MKLVSLFIFVLFSFSAYAEKANDLVDVNKDSKLSDYFKKINGKVTDDVEATPLNAEEEAPTTKADEKDILLKTATKKKAEITGMSPFQKMMMTVFGFLVIAGIMFAVMKKYGNKVGYSNIAKNIEILTQKPIGPKKNLMLIRVAGETILLGVTDHNINHLKTLSLMDDELPQYTNPKFSNQLKNKIEETRITDDLEEVDGFSVSSLDDVKSTVTERFHLS